MRIGALATAVIAAYNAIAAIQEPAPSRAWVRDYVSNTVQTAMSHADGIRTYTAGTGRSQIRLEVEDATVYALVVSAATPAAVSAGVTNGQYFVWHETSHSYLNKADAIIATSTNLIWRGVGSDGCSFAGWFDVSGVMLQPSIAKGVTE